MAIEVELVGNGHYAGSKSNVTQYAASEESTPIEGSDSSGGVGQLTFTVIDDPTRFGSSLLLNNEVMLSDGDRGTTVGLITELTSNDGILNASAFSRLGHLVVDKTVPFVNDDFDTIMRYYLSLGGIVDDVAIDSSLASINILAPGWSGDLWTKIKELCVYVGAEISLVRGSVVIRPVRQRDAFTLNNSSVSWSNSNNDMAREVEVFYYNTKYVNEGLIYPYGGWNRDVSVYTVEAGETTTVNIPVNVSIASLVQPTVMDYVSKTESSTSVYAVSGADGRPITASQWTGSGGRLRVDIGEDGTSIDVRITGGTGAMSKYAPYRIAVTAGNGDYYSSLRILGTGAGYDKQSVIVPTGADESRVARDVGVSVDNVFVATQSQAYNIAMDVAAKWASPVRTISVVKTDINKPGETSGSFNYATFTDFDEYAATENLVTFADFDVEWATKSFKQFDNFWYEKVKDDFDFQAFGNANGARVPFRRAMYRIRSAEISASTVTYTAEADTTFADFDASASGMTFENFDASFAGLTFAEFGLIPLPNVREEYDRL